MYTPDSESPPQPVKRITKTIQSKLKVYVSRPMPTDMRVFVPIQSNDNKVHVKSDSALEVSLDSMSDTESDK